MQQQHTSLKSQAIVQPVLQNQIVGRVQQQPSPKSQSPKKQMTDSTFVNGKMTQTQFEQLCKHHLIDFTKGRNARDPEYGRTLLMMLIRKRWFQAAEALIASFPDVDVTVDQEIGGGDGSLVMNGDFVDVKVDATFSEQGFTALHYAAKANAPVSLIRSIVNRGADVNAHTSICEEREQDEYQTACNGGEENVYGSLYNRTALALCEPGSEMARTLLAMGVDPTIYPLRQCFERNGDDEDDGYEGVAESEPHLFTRLVSFYDEKAQMHAVNAFVFSPEMDRHEFFSALREACGYNSLESIDVYYRRVTLNPSTFVVESNHWIKTKISGDNWKQAHKEMCFYCFALGEQEEDTPMVKVKL